jgi:YidC/Oxa1 family membrane protein insertase
MFSFLYHTFIYDPIYNFLVALFKVVPAADAGIAIIVVTVVVRLILFPLSRKAVKTQVEMQRLGPALEDIKANYKDKPEEQARATLALYKERGVNPFSGIFVILLQLPIIFALYSIFRGLPAINTGALYSFISVPENVNTIFLGILDLGARSFLLAILAAVTTFIQMWIATRMQAAPKGNSFGDNLTRSMQMQMKYFFPIIVFFISYHLAGVIALYWFVSNLFTIGQELVVRRKIQA